MQKLKPPASNLLASFWKFTAGKAFNSHNRRASPGGPALRRTETPAQCVADAQPGTSPERRRQTITSATAAGEHDHRWQRP
jgi:hypothetical protein